MLVKNLVVDEITYSEGSAEVLRVRIKRKRGGRRDYAVVYIPPKTKSWSTEDYGKMLMDTSEHMEGLIARSDNIILIGDFKCK